MLKWFARKQDRSPKKSQLPDSTAPDSQIKDTENSLAQAPIGRTFPSPPIQELSPTPSQETQDSLYDKMSLAIHKLSALSLLPTKAEEKPEPKPDTPPTIVEHKTKPHLNPPQVVPDNFWTEIVLYPHPVSSVDYYDPGPQGEWLRQDIHQNALRVKQERERYDANVASTTKHKI